MEMNLVIPQIEYYAHWFPFISHYHSIVVYSFIPTILRLATFQQMLYKAAQLSIDSTFDTALPAKYCHFYMVRYYCSFRCMCANVWACVCVCACVRVCVKLMLLRFTRDNVKCIVYVNDVIHTYVYMQIHTHTFPWHVSVMSMLKFKSVPT